MARLIRETGLTGVSRRRGTRTTRVDSCHRAAPDRVERHFQADAPNRLWVADVTYLPTWAGFVYLAIVLDVFSRRVLASGDLYLEMEMYEDGTQPQMAKFRWPDQYLPSTADRGLGVRS